MHPHTCAHLHAHTHVLQIVLAGSRYEPSMADLAEYDPSIARSLESIRLMPTERFKVRSYFDWLIVELLVEELRRLITSQRCAHRSC
jgi:6-pyruvoyl-tetrahydropterin synthase